MENLTYKFGNVSVGIHGHDLPQFADSKTIEYWKKKKEFENSPNFVSHRELQKSKQYWAPVEDIYLNDIRDEHVIPPILQKDYIARKYKKEVANSVNHSNTIVHEEAPTTLTRRQHGSWATKEADYKKWKSNYEEDPYQRVSYVKHLNKPLYSSFTADKVFPTNENGNTEY